MSTSRTDSRAASVSAHATGATSRIDAHQHFWHYNAHEYAWIDHTMSPLQRDFLPADLAPLLHSAGIGASIAVEARQTLEETRWLLSLAAESPLIAGVIGYAPIASPAFADIVSALLANPKLRGLRHLVQAEPDPLFLRDPAFNAGIGILAGTGLVYDLLVLTPQLEETIRFVDRHALQPFVLDHCAKPPFSSGKLQQWKLQIKTFAERPNVACKLSGLVTEADWQSWTPETLQPAFDTVLEAFGPSRLLFGSDWPVASVASDYQRWVATVAHWLNPLSPTEQSAIWGNNATRIYSLAAVPPLQSDSVGP